MKHLLILISFLLLSSCVKDIWNEPGKRDPITGEWVKWCPPILRNIDEVVEKYKGKSGTEHITTITGKKNTSW